MVVLDKAGNAEGSLYVDDGETFDYESGAQIFAKFVFDKESSSLTSPRYSQHGFHDQVLSPKNVESPSGESYFNWRTQPLGGQEAHHGRAGLEEI